MFKAYVPAKIKQEHSITWPYQNKINECLNNINIFTSIEYIHFYWAISHYTYLAS